MGTKVYWALSVLIVLLIGAFVLVMVNQHAENKQLERDLAEALEKLVAQKKEANTAQVVVVSDEKPPDEPGFMWVRHGDHWDKVPINNPNKPIDHPPVMEKSQATKIPNRSEKFVDLTSDEGLRYFYLGGRFSKEQLIQLKEGYTRQIEILEDSIPKYHASIKYWQDHFIRHPNSTDGRKIYEQDLQSLDDYSRRLRYLKRSMEVLNDIK